MKMIDIRSKSDDDLLAEYRNLKEELFSLKFQSATSQLENHRQIPRIKRDVARVLTVMRERKIEAEAAQSK